MYLLYLDESGAHSQARHFVLAGVAIYEASVYWADNELNRLQTQYFPGIAESVLFHATPLRAGERDRVPYRAISYRNRHSRLPSCHSHESGDPESPVFLNPHFHGNDDFYRQ